MAQPYIGEIRMFAGTFAPLGWLFCDGQLLPISENETLFQLIGTTYGGDGQENFALPNLQSRVPMHQGTGLGLSTRILASAFGSESETLNTNQIPVHTHALLASGAPGGTPNPTGGMLALPTSVQPGIAAYAPTADVAMRAGMIGATGGSQPHSNLQPYLVISYIISLFGIFPSPT